MKIMAVDYGDSHTGIAVCDRMEILASPVGIIHEKNFEVCIQKTAHMAKEYQVGEIVVGNPLNMNGSVGPRSEKCTIFAQKLSELVDIPVRLWDERSSTVTAHNLMNEANKRGKKRKAVIDAAAAAVILESYLNFRRMNNNS